ncbi:MAG: ATP-binding cassette domain-containing protein [Methanomassiliicoccales archaeon]|nr:ATP-binding cassette domain-containing protein [Methanomassiliicoccales archaeon]NYT16046.1 ATP-binding cassette domain-containing protein [Methanomassiliicoccales archaeon]
MVAIVQVKNLVKVYNGSVRAVDDISFEVNEGEIFGFLGPNGAGKTTTISMLTTLIKPTSGNAKVVGHDIVKEAHDVRNVIGLVPQDLTVDDDLTGRENMILQGDLYKVPKEELIKRVEGLLDLVGLTDAEDRMVKTYSGGMRKRLELAEGLVHHPKVLFLDEPTLGLDVQTRAAMWEHIMDLKKKHNTTIFLTTHYLEEADSLCDRIAIIDHGKIVALDSPRQLKASLGGDVIEVSVESEVDGSDSISGLEGVIEVQFSEGKYRIKVTSGENVAPSVLKILWDQGVAVKSVNISQPNLDQVFMEYTGRSLRDAMQSSVQDRGQRMARAMQSRRRR